MFDRVLNTPLEVIKNGLCMDQLSKNREYNDKLNCFSKSCNN